MNAANTLNRTLVCLTEYICVGNVCARVAVIDINLCAMNSIEHKFPSVRTHNSEMPSNACENFKAFSMLLFRMPWIWAYKFKYFEKKKIKSKHNHIRHTWTLEMFKQMLNGPPIPGRIMTFGSWTCKLAISIPPYQLDTNIVLVSSSLQHAIDHIEQYTSAQEQQPNHVNSGVK